HGSNGRSEVGKSSPGRDERHGHLGEPAYAPVQADGRRRYFLTRRGQGAFGVSGGFVQATCGFVAGSGRTRVNPSFEFSAARSFGSGTESAARHSPNLIATPTTWPMTSASWGCRSTRICSGDKGWGCNTM